jgi:catechol 2,3-dioxygenase-like lactoylglutathione lyase family enzyme
LQPLRALTIGLALAASGLAQLAPPNEAGVAMGHVHLNVRDVEAQRKFWMELFGASPLKKEGLAGVKIPGMLILFRRQEPTGGSEGTVMDHFGLKVPNLAESLARVRAAGFTVQREFTGTEGFPNAYIMGPDEVKIELQQDAALTRPAIGYHLHFVTAVGAEVPLMQWYAKTFGAVIKKRGNHEAADVPGMNLTFGTSKIPPTLGTEGRSIDHIGFEVKNLEAFCKKLEKDGVKFKVAYRKLPRQGLAAAFLTDPSGVYVELTEDLDRY